MFTLIVTVLAALAVAGFLIRIADATTTDVATTRTPALRASETLRPSAHPGVIR
jgi:hypothetical protein